LENLPDEKLTILFVDIRDPYEFKKIRIENAINIPRGILKTAYEWTHDETIPELVKARKHKVILICRSGNRSLLAVQTLRTMGYEDIYSLKTGLRRWNEYARSRHCECR